MILTIIQIVYVIINLFGIVSCIISLCRADGDSLIYKMFSFVADRFGRVLSIITSSLLILIFLPTVTFMAAFTIIVLLCGTIFD